VRDAANTILWSWHIWVTDYVLGTDLKTITNFQNYNYTILPVNLGWCDEKKENYAGREVKIRFKQQTTQGYVGTTETMTVKQKAKEIIYSGNNTFYQWGRKDPFVGLWTDLGTKRWYDTSGIVYQSDPATEYFSIGNTCIISGIKKPNVFNINIEMEATYANLWSANNKVYTNNDEHVEKTVYDPSPMGYKLPPSNAFTGFTTTGENVFGVPSLLNVNTWNSGWLFYCGLNHTGDTVFFPASGFRLHDSGTTIFVGSDGLCWQSIPGTSGRGRSLYFSIKHVYPLNIDIAKSFGFPVRASRE